MRWVIASRLNAHVQTVLLVAPVAPASVAFPQLGPLDQRGHRHGADLHQIAREQLLRSSCNVEHLLHLGDHLIRFAVLLFVVNTAKINQRIEKEIIYSPGTTKSTLESYHSPMWKTLGPLTTMANSLFLRHCCDKCCNDQSQL